MDPLERIPALLISVVRFVNASFCIVAKGCCEPAPDAEGDVNEKRLIDQRVQIPLLKHALNPCGVKTLTAPTRKLV